MDSTSNQSSRNRSPGVIVACPDDAAAIVALGDASRSGLVRPGPGRIGVPAPDTPTAAVLDYRGIWSFGRLPVGAETTPPGERARPCTRRPREAGYLRSGPHAGTQRTRLRAAHRPASLDRRIGPLSESRAERSTPAIMCIIVQMCTWTRWGSRVRRLALTRSVLFSGPAIAALHVCSSRGHRVADGRDGRRLAVPTVRLRGPSCADRPRRGAPPAMAAR